MLHSLLYVILSFLLSQAFFAGDDIRTVLIILALFRAIQVGFSFSILARAILENKSHKIKELEDSTQCIEVAATEDKWTFIYASTSILLSLLSLCLVGPMFHYSGMGTPVSIEQKRMKALYLEIITDYSACSFNSNILYRDFIDRTQSA